MSRINFAQLAIGVLGLTCLTSWLARPSRGDQPNAALREKALPKPTKLYFGVLACSNGGCHDNPPNPNQKDILLCDYDEVRIWSTQDKHKDANKVLKEPRSLQMAKLLGIKGDISREPSCISCHGVLVEDPKLIHKPSFNLDEGVSCVACHGAYKEWVGRHADFLERESWRALSPARKEAEFGMRDLWDPEKRAALCVSCHIGNTAEGKVVTHAMYAAGHPPLPGFELATFEGAMPRHWKYLAEKKPAVQKIVGYDPSQGELERTQLVVVAGLVSFRASMNLLASQAQPPLSPPGRGAGGEGAAAQDPDKGWPEFAQFDCYACHHDLKADSWRGKRGYTGKPGRPDMRSWPLALVHLGILHTGKGDAVREKMLTGQMHARMQDLSSAFNAQPFGDAAQVAAGARKMSQWTDDLLKDLRKTNRFDRPAAERLLGDLGKIAKTRLVDFDSARQLTWALRTIQDELNPGQSRHAESDRLLKTLRTQLQLDLPRGRVEIAKDYLKDTLKKINNFEPEKFQSTFEQLIRSVPKPAQQSP